MAENESIGGISVEIVGDYSHLPGDLQAAEQIATRGAEQIADAFTGAADKADVLSGAVAAVADSMGSFESQVQSLVDSGSTLAEALAQVGTEAAGIAGSLEETGAAAADAGGQLSEFGAAAVLPAEATGQLEAFAGELDPIGSAAEAAASGMGGMADAAGAVATAFDDSTAAAGGFADAAGAAAGATGTFEQQIQSLVDSGSTLAEALATVQERTEAMASATATAGAEAEAGFSAAAAGADQMAGSVAAAGDASAQAAEQLSLFNEAAMVDYSDAAGQLNLFATEIEPIGPAADGAAGALAGMREGAEQAASGMRDAVPAIEETTSSTGDLVQQLVALGAALGFTAGLVEFGMAALEAADAVDDAAMAMGALSGNAAEAEASVSELRDVADDQALGMPELLSAATRMTAFLGSSQPVPGILRAVGDSAAVMKNSVEGAAQAYTKIIASGDLSQRSLQRLGLTLDDVAGAMHTTAEKAAAAFKAMDQSKKVEVMNQALEKFKGQAERMANDGLGAMTRAGNAWNDVLVSIGKSLDPVIKGVADFVKTDIMPFIQGLAEAFAMLPDPIKNTVAGIALLAVAIVPIVGAVVGVSAAFTALAGVLAPVGAAFGVLSTSILGATASWSAFLASGALSVAGWVAVVAAIYMAVKAYGAMQDAIAGAERATAVQIASLSKLEGSLRAQGANITDVMNKYHAGTITYEQYMVALRDVAIELGKGNAAHREHVSVVTASAAAVDGARLKMAGMKEAVVTTRQALTDATQAYRDNKGSAEAVTKAYDAWQSATTALKGAQQSHLPVVRELAVATKEFNTSLFEMPTAAQATANALDATGIKLVAQNEALATAERNLNNVIARYRDHNATAAEVATALDHVTAAQKTANDAMLAAAPPTAVWKPAIVDLALLQTRLTALIGPLQAIPPPIRTAADALHAMGIEADKLASVVGDRLIATYTAHAAQLTGLVEEKAAWDSVSSAVENLASRNLPAAMAVYEAHIAQLQRLHATEGELLDARAKGLELIIKTAEQSGASATSQIIALEMVKMKQQALIDSSRMMGDMYVSILHDITGGFDQMGGAINDAMWEGENLGKAFANIGKTILKSITQDIINTGLKALKNAVLGLSGDVAGLEKSFTKLAKSISDAFSGGAKAGAGVAAPGISQSGGAGAGAIGGIGAVGSIISAISGVIGNFQSAKMETTMNATEENTRKTAIEVAQFRADVWAMDGGLLVKLDDLWAQMRNDAQAIVGTLENGFQAMLSGAGQGGNVEIIQAMHDGMNLDIQIGNALVATIGEGVNNLGTAIVQSANAITFALMSGFQALINTIGGVKKYATGGPVPMTGLAMLHAGEVVVPPGGAMPAGPGAGSYANSTVNSGGNMTVNLTIQESSSPRETARQVTGALTQLSPSFAAFAT